LRAEEVRMRYGRADGAWLGGERFSEETTEGERACTDGRGPDPLRRSLFVCSRVGRTAGGRPYRNLHLPHKLQLWVWMTEVCRMTPATSSNPPAESPKYRDGATLQALLWESLAGADANPPMSESYASQAGHQKPVHIPINKLAPFPTLLTPDPVLSHARGHASLSRQRARAACFSRSTHRMPSPASVLSPRLPNACAVPLPASRPSLERLPAVPSTLSPPSLRPPKNTN
jgi:hypothetical protein